MHLPVPYKGSKKWNYATNGGSISYYSYFHKHTHTHTCSFTPMCKFYIQGDCPFGKIVTSVTEMTEYRVQTAFSVRGRSVFGGNCDGVTPFPEL